MKQQEKLFKEIAKHYMEIDGQQLKDENQLLKNENISPPTPKMDAEISKLHAKPSKNTFFSSPKQRTLAACLLIFLLAAPLYAPLLFRNYGFNTDSAESGIINESGTASSTTSMIPLNFELPQGYAVTKEMEDQGESIYLLSYEDSFDDIFLSLKRDALSEYDLEKFTSLTINNQQAYSLTEEGYTSLLFAKEGITYYLSCKSNSSEILQLAKNIL